MSRLIKNNIIKIVFSLVILVFAMTGCVNNDEKIKDGRLQVAVSIVPEATFVEKVGGNLVNVVTIIPPGSSPANYQPTPQEMIALENSLVYFAIGVPTEAANIIPNMVDNSDVKVVELHHIVGDVYRDRIFGVEDEHDEDEHDKDNNDEDHDGHDHGEGTRDPHIWLSPKRVIVMIQEIRDTLSELDPDNANIYADNAAKYIEELKVLDEEIKEMFADKEHKGFIITHPSIGYFADDYGLHMTSLEKDGKTATAAWMQQVIDFAVEKDIHVVFYQAEFDSTQSSTLAEAIKGTAMEIAPLSPDYINNLRAMAKAFLEH